MPFGRTVKITAVEVDDIFARLQPYLPSYLTEVGPNEYGYLRYSFRPFTGREEEPRRPRAYRDDPRLKYVAESDDPVEHALRKAAEQILLDVYDAARDKWRDAAYVANLRTTIGDALERWQTYERARKELESAYSHLRTPEAAREWMAALSRLVDAQDRAQAAAAIFDERAEEIAQVHRKHRDSDLCYDTAFAAAGHPEAKDWHVVDAEDYHRGYYFSGSPYVPLAEIVRRVVEEQDAHVTKVGRLSGTATN